MNKAKMTNAAIEIVFVTVLSPLCDLKGFVLSDGSFVPLSIKNCRICQTNNHSCNSSTDIKDKALSVVSERGRMIAGKGRMWYVTCEFTMPDKEGCRSSTAHRKNPHFTQGPPINGGFWLRFPSAVLPWPLTTVSLLRVFPFSQTSFAQTHPSSPG